MGSSPRQDSDAPDATRSPQSARHIVDVSNSSVLNSWKEIARYLGRGVRTVQRWERELGLPIHRPKGRDRSATLALTSELDEWLSATPVRSCPDGRTGDGRLRNSPNSDDRGLSAVRVGPPLAKDEPPQRHLILSVDDEPGLLYTREKILECQGYEVLSAANGEKALEFLGTHPVDLVLLDYQMPGMDGGTVAREIKRRAPTVPIIMISGNRVPGEALASVDCFIPKGRGPELLLAATRELLMMMTDSCKTTERAKPSRQGSCQSRSRRQQLTPGEARRHA